MIKIILLIGIFSWQLIAGNNESISNIYYHIFHDITQKEKIKVYTDNIECKRAFATSEDLIVVNDVTQADIILLSHQKNIEKFSKLSFSKDVVFFTTHYKFLKFYPQFVGAFYWKKGRSQLVFVKKRLKNYHIKLPKEYHKFIVDIL